MVRIIVFCDSVVERTMEVEDKIVVIGRASKEASKRVVKPGETFLPLNSSAVSSTHCEVTFTDDTITVRDTSRSGVSVSHGGRTATVHQESYSMPGTTGKFVIIILSKGTEFRVEFALTDDPDTEGTELTDNAVEPASKGSKGSSKAPAKKAAPASKTAQARKPELKPKPKPKSKQKEAPRNAVPKRKASKAKADGADNEPEVDVPPDEESSVDVDLSAADEGTAEDAQEPSVAEAPSEEEPDGGDKGADRLADPGDAFRDALSIEDKRLYDAKYALLPANPCFSTEFTYTNILNALPEVLRMEVWNTIHAAPALEVLEDLEFRVEKRLCPEKACILFANSFKRTPRFYLALHRGIPIVTEEWLHRCAKTVLKDSGLAFPHLRKYLLDPPVEQLCDPSEKAFLAGLQAQKYCLGAVLAQSFRHPILILHYDHVIVAAEAVANKALSTASPETDLAMICGFCDLVYDCGVRKVSLVHDAAHDHVYSAPAFLDQYPDHRRRNFRSFRPNARVPDLAERILQAARAFAAPASTDESSQEQPTGNPSTRVLFIVPSPAQGPALYEPYARFKGDVEGLTFVQMTREGVLHSIVRHEMLFEEYVL